MERKEKKNIKGRTIKRREGRRSRERKITESQNKEMVQKKRMLQERQKERQKQIKDGKTEFLQPAFLRHSYTHPRTYCSYLAMSHITVYFTVLSVINWSLKMYLLVNCHCLSQLLYILFILRRIY
jgi:hypothetical protein